MLEPMIYNSDKLRKKILVTRTQIDREAVRYLHNEGFDCIFSPPFDSPEVVAKRAADENIDAMIVSQGKITRDVIAASPSLKVITKHGSGVNNINLRAAEEFGIPVFRTPGANARAVAEFTLTLVLTLWKSIPSLEEASRNEKWVKSSFIGKDFTDSVIGLIGYGAIGQELSKMAISLGFKVLVFDPFIKKLPEKIQFTSNLYDLISNVDVLSIHCPLTSQTKNLISTKQLKMMKKGSVLVNTARGGIVDEEALAEALMCGHLSGAALDSFSHEPPDFNMKIWRSPNFIGTSHVAGQTPGAENSMAMGAAQNIVNYFKGIEIPEIRIATFEKLGGLIEE